MPTSKKFFDIIPPSKRQFTQRPPNKNGRETSGFNVRPEEDSALIKRELEKRDKMPFFSRTICILLLFFILAGAWCYLTLSKSIITLRPYSQNLTLNEKITADTQITDTNPVFWVNNMVLPAKFFSEEKSSSEQFSSTGKGQKRAKAQGQIRVYNAYSTASQVFVANTRFISAEGKLFKSIGAVTVPGKKYEKDKLVPGYIDIQVKAAEDGPDFNIGPSTFSIPGLAGTAKYTAFYGKSFSQMTGGFEGEVSIVTQGDLENAKSSLVRKSMDELKKDLQNKIPSDYVLLDQALKQDLLDSSSSVSAGSESDFFDCNVRVKTQIVAFKKSDIENFVKQHLASKMPEVDIQTNRFVLKKNIWEGSLKINYQAEEVNFPLNPEKDPVRIVLNTGYSAVIYPEIDMENFKKELSGMSLNESRVFLSDQPYLAGTEIRFWPFWVSRVPKDPNNIKVSIVIE